MEKPDSNLCEQRTSENGKLKEESDSIMEESSQTLSFLNLSIESDLNSSIRACENADFLQDEVEAIEKIPGVIKDAIILIVGDSGTGKSLLASAFTPFPRSKASHYIKTVVDLADTLNRPRCCLGLHIFCAPFRKGDYDCFLRDPLENPPYDLVIFIFDMNVRKSFKNIIQKWHLEVLSYLFRRQPPYLLVGNKVDKLPRPGFCSDSETDDYVSHHEGVWWASKMGAHKYLEISALTDTNTEFVTQIALDLIL
ncbi:uncharacterized protein TNIN_66571 [Trichonephila inaurata madagascariensis]|uniref:GTP-binding protein n=1 Tax=Trichonephila inaurata madagascariensis TaxID=2747483 RepID=A0A8X6KDB2_9ARAC|nr:uncharacterized protein TNIN_66571 [Trichonephila inaurata madagascariensis]